MMVSIGPEESLITAPQFLRHGRCRNDLLNPSIRVTMQAVRGMKNAPRPSREPISGKRRGAFLTTGRTKDSGAAHGDQRSKERRKERETERKAPQIIRNSIKRFICLFCIRKVVASIPIRPTKNGTLPKEGPVGRVRQRLEDLECPGQHRDISEGIVIFQAVADGPESAHGETGEEGVLPPMGEGEHPAAHLHQFPANVGSKVIVGDKLIHIKAVLPRGHNHGQIPVLRQPLDVGVQRPIRIVTQQSVEQVKRLIWLVFPQIAAVGERLIRGPDAWMGTIRFSVWERKLT